MAGPTWWLVHGATFLGLVACIALTMRASRRVGPRTPHGQFLVVLSLAFWLLLCGFVVFRGHELIVGERARSGNLGDVFQLTGYVLLTVTFYLFTLRFPRKRAGRARRALVPVALAVPPGLGMLALYHFVLAPGADYGDPRHAAQALYLVNDGLALGVLAASVERLYRFRATAIGRLFLQLGAALVVLTLADVAWNWFTPRGGKPVLVDVAYASASALAVIALGAHAAQAARHPEAPERFADPTLRVEQRVLRDVARQLKGLAGEYGQSLALANATRELAARGFACRVVGDVVEADAPEDAWRDALARVRDGALASIGEGARASFRSVADAYGERFAFLAGGPSS